MQKCHDQIQGLIKHISSFFIAICCIILSYPTAAAMATTPTSHLWSVIASLGYTNYQNMYLNDGQTAVGRVAIGRELFTKQQTLFGLELGLQNGNSMRVGASQATLNKLGGLPIQSTVKPMLDLLLTAKTATFSTIPIFGQLKGGVAYRRWQFENRTSVNDISNLAAEIQVGVGVPLNPTTSLSLLYQGIYGGSPNFTANSADGTGHVSTIPVQQGILLSLSFNF